MADNVATPLERQFMQIPGLQVVDPPPTWTGALVLSCSLTFQECDSAATDVSGRHYAAPEQLPCILPIPPTFTKTNPNASPIITSGSPATAPRMAASSTTPIRKSASASGSLLSLARWAVYGAQSAVRLRPTLPRCRAHLPLMMDGGAEVTGPLHGAANLTARNHTVLLQPEGQLRAKQQLRNLIVRQDNGAPVLLKDIAT